MTRLRWHRYSQFGFWGHARPGGVSGELSPASVYVSLLPVVEARVVVAVPRRVGEFPGSPFQPSWHYSYSLLSRMPLDLYGRHGVNDLASVLQR